MPDDRSLLAPSLTWRPDGATSPTLQALWQQDKSGSSSQFFPWEGTLLPNPNGTLPTSRFTGEPGDYYNSERKTFGWLFEHQFNETWTVRQNFRLARNESDNRYHYGDFFTITGGWGADPTAKRLLGRYNDSALTRNRIATLDNHAESHFDTGALKHTLLLGADFAHHRENVWGGATYSEIDAYAPVYGNLLIPAREARPGTLQRQTGFYVQDQIKLDQWIFLAGLCHDQAPGTDVRRTRGLVTHYNYTELDKQLEGLPKHQASVWGKYRFALGGVNGFSASATYRF